MKKTIVISLFIIMAAGMAQAQTLTGRVFGLNDQSRTEALEFASVFWKGGSVAATTNKDGAFTIEADPKASNQLIAAFVGFKNDTLTITDFSKEVVFTLQLDNSLDAVVLTGRQAGNFISKMAPVKTEVISAAGLCKMACCNLAESFENSASVTVGYADAITGARQIRLLGLGGSYTQMLEESQPTMRGLLSTFGLSYIPGQWLESIQIAKGAGSVTKGCESITGQINMEYRKPTTEQPLFVQLFLSNHLRTEVNVASSLQINPKLSTVVLAHTSHNLMEEDSNEDGFLDEPLTHQYNVANRWLYAATNGAQLRFGFRALYEDRRGGQKDFTGPTWNKWGTVIDSKGLSAYVKLGIPLAPEREDQADNANYVRPNLAFVADYTYHNIDSYFGMRNYDGNQNNYFLNAIFMASAGKLHKYTIGISASIDDYKELLSPFLNGAAPMTHRDYGNILDPSRIERQAGFYGEYTLNVNDKLLLIAGLREDYNDHYGWLFTPKVNLKYDFLEDLTFRASAGKGFRSPNVIADNLGMLSTSRAIRLTDDPKMEEAWIYGANITMSFPLGNVDKAQLSFDYFRTDFKNQFLMDQEVERGYVDLYNLDGRSYTNTYQADFNCTPFTGFTAMLTFRYNESKVELRNQGLVERPLQSKYKGVLNLQYATNMNIWTFDFTAQINGPARIPNLSGNIQSILSGEYEYSPVYPMFYLQVTKRFKGVDVYLGGENLLNYRQKNPIIEAGNPYSPDFNASIIWGPLMGTTVYIGARYTLWK